MGKGKERKGKERKGKERKGKERKGKEILQLLNLQTWGKRLLQLLSLLLVCNLQGIQETRAPNLELDIVCILLDLDALSILPPCLKEEILNFLDFTWHGVNTSLSRSD